MTRQLVISLSALVVGFALILVAPFDEFIAWILWAVLCLGLYKFISPITS